MKCMLHLLAWDWRQGHVTLRTIELALDPSLHLHMFSAYVIHLMLYNF